MRYRNAYPGKLHRPLMYRWDMDWELTPPTAQEIEAFKGFLDRLVQVEQFVMTERARQRAWLDGCVARGEIDEYETEIELAFHLRENDPAFIEDDDNIFFQVNHHYEPVPALLELDWDVELYKAYPLHGYPHPHLFHELRVHSRIPHRDMMRIGTIWVDLDFTVQRHFREPGRNLSSAPP